ncbi:hypothetical protein Bca4012_065074 [Brassica carinata]
MSSRVYYRSWMDKPHMDPNTNLLTDEYVQGIREFMRLVQQKPNAKTGLLRCPYSTCNNNRVIKEFDVWSHLYMRGFSRNYKVWYHHGKTCYEYGSTSKPQPVSEPQPDIRLEEPRTDIDYGVGTEQMVCYISYPRVTYRDDPWVTVTQINPRGRVDGTSDNEPLQPDSTSNVSAVEDLADVGLVENFSEFGLDGVVHSESEAEVGEFDDDSEDSD